MKIALDVMGGDFAPKNNIEGALQALKELPDDCTIVLIGNKNKIEDYFSKNELNASGFEIIHAEDEISMDEHPTQAFSKKPNSSIAKGFYLLKKKEADAFCSAGNTGAMHVGAMFSVKSIEGIIRPGIAGFVPKENGGYGVIIDIGANADCKPDVLLQFGEIGHLYAKHVFEIENPKIGLMNLGEEERKGSLHTQAAFQLFKFHDKLNFAGNIEGRDLFNEKVDVIVCDGFTGNVLLKAIESFYDLLRKRNLLDSYFEKFNYEAIGGSPILGVNGTVIIAHGASSSLAINNGLKLAYNMAKTKLNEHIKEWLAEY